MEEANKVIAYLLAIGLLPLAIAMSLAAYGLSRWYYGINDIYLKETAIKTDTVENADKAKKLSNALKIIKLIPILVGIGVTVAMQFEAPARTAAVIISTCLGVVHAFIGVTAYELLIEFRIFKIIEAKFIKTGE
jgi:hypothetical protein